MGIDVGSTTVKIVLLDDNKNILFSKYQRHFSDIKKTVYDLFCETKEFLKKSQLADISFTVVITGSGGLLLANLLDFPFVQEVICKSSI